MRSIFFSIVILLVNISCAGTRSEVRKPYDSKKVYPRLNTTIDDPEIRKHLKNISNGYDQRRFVSFYKKGIGEKLNITKKHMEQVITAGLRYLGRRYRFGVLDCSSFTYGAFSAAGLHIPRTAEAQARYGKIISDKTKLKRGDLLFFTRTYTTSWFVTHVGIYLGENRMLHAASDIVKITAFPEPGYWWKNHYVFGTRIVRTGKTNTISTNNGNVKRTSWKEDNYAPEP